MEQLVEVYQLVFTQQLLVFSLPDKKVKFLGEKGECLRQKN